jgi:predicted nuclease of predicted toxin-antitoxin system
MASPCSRRSLDFGAILAATNGRKPSVIQIRSEDLDPDVVGARIVSAIQQMSSELDEGALLTVDAKRTRVRILPLRP